MIDTKTAARRQLNYASLNELVADAERLVAANASTSGNWSVGQILEHIASVMEKSIDGFGVQGALPMRLLGRFVLKNWFLKHGMTPGFQLKGKFAKELLPPEVDTQQALEHLRTAANRLLTETKRAENPIFGLMEQEESNRFNCRHAELHMSFIKDEA